MSEVAAAPLMPHCLPSEKYILSNFMRNPGMLEEFPLEPDLFYLPAHQILYRRMVAEPGLNLLVLVPRLHDCFELEAVGGPAAVSEIYTYAAGDNFATMLERLRNRYARRLQIRACCAGAEAAYDCSDDTAFLEFIGAPMTAVFDAATAAKAAMDPKAVGRQFLEIYEARLNGKELTSGVPFGIAEIDRHLKGMFPAHYGIISGRSGSGKSSLATQIAGAVAKTGVPLLYLILERTEVSAYERSVIQLSGLPHGVISDPRGYAAMQGESKPHKEELIKVRMAMQSLSGSPFYMRKPPNRRLTTILAEIRRYVRLHDVRVVVLDQIGLVRGSRVKGDSEEAEKRAVSNWLQELAHELGITLVVLSQVNDDGETKGARAVEEDADWHLSIVQERDRKKENFGEHQHVLIAKDSHHGSEGERLPLILDHQTVRFIYGFPKPQEPKKKARAFTN